MFWNAASALDFWTLFLLVHKVSLCDRPSSLVRRRPLKNNLNDNSS